MPDNDPNPALRAELEAALAVLEQDVRGLGYLSQTQSPSPELDAFIDEQLTVFVHRRDGINDVLAALDVVIVKLDILYAEGYPSVSKIPVDTPLFQQLTAEVADIEAAKALFESEPVATTIAINLGAPKPKE